MKFRVSEEKRPKLQRMVEIISSISPMSYMQLNSNGLSLEACNQSDRYAGLHIDTRWFVNKSPWPLRNPGFSVTLNASTFNHHLIIPGYYYEFLELYFEIRPQDLAENTISLILKYIERDPPISPSDREEREWIIRAMPAGNLTDLLTNNPSYTFLLDINAGDFLRIVNEAVEARERYLHIETSDSFVAISAGNNRPFHLHKDFGCRIYGRIHGVPDGMCCKLHLDLESVDVIHLNSFSEYLHVITIKVAHDERRITASHPRLTKKRIQGIVYPLPPLLEYEIKFDEFARIWFHYPLHEVPSVRANL